MPFSPSQLVVFAGLTRLISRIGQQHHLPEHHSFRHHRLWGKQFLRSILPIRATPHANTPQIDVQQDYLNGGPTGDPTNGVIISGVHFIGVTGTVTSSAYDYYILCGSGSCSDFTFSGTKITGGKTSCNYPSTGCPT